MNIQILICVYVAFMILQIILRIYTRPYRTIEKMENTYKRVLARIEEDNTVSIENAVLDLYLEGYLDIKRYKYTVATYFYTTSGLYLGYLRNLHGTFCVSRLPTREPGKDNTSQKGIVLKILSILKNNSRTEEQAKDFEQVLGRFV